MVTVYIVHKDLIVIWRLPVNSSTWHNHDIKNNINHNVIILMVVNEHGGYIYIYIVYFFLLVNTDA
jgi:hypothetical protein